MKTIKFGAAILLFATMISCNNETTENVIVENINPIETEAVVKDYQELLVGSWVEKNPINEYEVQGIEIIKGGEAKSINMATLLYKNWWFENDTLFLVEESIGNRISFIDTISYTIYNIDKNSLTLTNKYFTKTYQKKK